MERLIRVARRIAVVIFGLAAGALATFIHFALVPVGLIVALLGSLACALMIRAYTGSRADVSLFAIAWTLVVYRGGTNAGEELLIMANTPGYLLLYLGPLLVFFPLILPRQRTPEREVSELS